MGLRKLKEEGLSMNKIDKPEYRKPYVIPVRKLSRQMYRMDEQEVMKFRIWFSLAVALLLLVFS